MIDVSFVDPHSHTHTLRNGIQTLDYAETMQFAIRDRGAHEIVGKISKYMKYSHTYIM